MIYFNGYNKIFSKYCEKENFIYLAKKSILDSIEEITNKTIRDQVKKKGLNKLHHFFSPDYLPFLASSLEEKFNKMMYKQVYQTSTEDLKIKNKTFYIDNEIRYRIHYPFQVARKSKITRQVYKSLNLKNYKNADEELNKCIKNQSKYKITRNDLDRILYFGKLPEPATSHSPHRDSWFGHTFNALNFWWSISNVTERTGVILYNQTNNYMLQHEKNPPYLKKDKHYIGRPKTISLNDGELLVFDPEILHASRIITNDETRIVFTARINENKPSFYKNSGDTEFPYWLKSDDIKNNKYNKIFTFHKKNNSFNQVHKKASKVAKFKKIIIKEKIKYKKKYKLFKKDKIDRSKNYKIIFKNYEISLLFRGGKSYVFKSRCPHQNFDLSLGHFDKSIVTCPGHGLKIDLKNGKSECKLFKTKVFRIFLKEKYYYLQT